jgi:hypothetical protein
LRPPHPTTPERRGSATPFTGTCRVPLPRRTLHPYMHPVSPDAGTTQPPNTNLTSEILEHLYRSGIRLQLYLTLPTKHGLCHSAWYYFATQTIHLRCLHNICTVFAEP